MDPVQAVLNAADEVLESIRTLVVVGHEYIPEDNLVRALNATFEFELAVDALPEPYDQLYEAIDEVREKLYTLQGVCVYREGPSKSLMHLGTHVLVVSQNLLGSQTSSQ